MNTSDPKRPSGEQKKPQADGAARNTPSTQAGDTQSMGSRAGASTGSQSPRTGMSDGGLPDSRSSQGLTGAQGSGGGLDRGHAGNADRGGPRDPDRGGQQSTDRGTPDAQDRED